MNSRLDRIKNWAELAHTASYCGTTLAKKVGVSLRQLERFILEAKGKCPRQWLLGLRIERALELIREGSTVKEAADKLGYKQRSHFSSDFKKHYGFAPSRQPKTVLQT